MANFQPWEYVDGQNRVRVATGPTKNPKKLTGTRLGKVLGLDSWGTPFQAWCEIMRVAEPPFEGNRYTEAGNVLEPKIIAWCRENVSPYVYSPEEFYGVTDAKKAKGYDFFDHRVLGGMWDAVILDGPLGKGTPLGYVECKTSSRPQDWADGVPPLKYVVQALLYAYLDGLEHVFIPVRFVEPEELDAFDAMLSGKMKRKEFTTFCDSLECTDDNTFLYELSVSETLIGNNDIESCVENARAWWEKHVEGNVSPEFDPKRDKEYLAIMRCNEVESHSGLEALAKDAALLEAKIEEIKVKNGLAALEKDLKKLKEQMKPEFKALFTATKDEVTAYGWRMKRTVKEKLDEDAIKADGLWSKYAAEETTYRLTQDKE